MDVFLSVFSAFLSVFSAAGGTADAACCRQSASAFGSG
jgi:hypothetical protein